MRKDIYSYAIPMALFLILLSLTGCNKNETIEGVMKPVIELDSEDGIYTVKVGRQLTFAPTFRNVADAVIEWSMDGEILSRGQVFTYVWQEEGTYYITLTATNEGGTAQEEIRVEVMGLTPPVVSLFLPDGGLKLLPGALYTFTPDIQHADMEGFEIEWYLNDELVSHDTSYTFVAETPGTYDMKIIASNIDGTTTREFSFEVVEDMPRSVSFLPPSYFQTSTDRYTFPGRPVFLTPALADFTSPSFRWEVDGDPVEFDGDTYKFTTDTPGEYTVKVIVTESSRARRRLSTDDSYKRICRSVRMTGDYMANVKVICVDATEESRRRAATPSSSKDCDKIYEWVPAPGQFINEAAMGGAEATHESAKAWAAECLTSNTPVSLGAFGGYMIVGFDHSVPLDPSGAYDFEVGGNAFASGAGDSNEPGIVWVMQDVNGNGLPDDEWYELKGSEYDASETYKNYAVTYYRPESPAMDVNWSDNRGATGVVDYVGEFHKQAYYYPAWIEADTYTLYGSRLKARNYYDESTGRWSNSPFDWGYVDNYGSDNVESARGQWTGLHISNAVFADGSEVGLQYIDFIKVQTGVQAKSGRLGELSTEVAGFRDASLK